jgi:hypothetical protein
MQYNHPILATHTFLHGITSFSRFRFLLGFAAALPLSSVAGLHRHGSPSGRRQLRQARGRRGRHLTAVVSDNLATLQITEEKAAEAHACVHAIALLLEEEQASATALEIEAATTTLQLTPTTTSSRAPPPPTSVGDSTTITTLHAHAYGVQNIHSFVLTVLDPSSKGYVCWRDQVLLTLKHYNLADHVLSDATSPR